MAFPRVDPPFTGSWLEQVEKIRVPKTLYDLFSIRTWATANENTLTVVFPTILSPIISP
jgi:hypothetical protein